MTIRINRKRFLIACILAAVILAAIIGYRPALRQFVYPCKYQEIVERAAEEYEVDPLLVYSIIKAESSFREDATSSKGAKGLMQITDETARWAYGKMDFSQESNIYSPEVNIHVGTWYIAKLLKDNDHSLIAALASYNAGGSNVERWKDDAGTDQIEQEDIQFGETGKYVEKTLKYYKSYQNLYR